MPRESKERSRWRGRAGASAAYSSTRRDRSTCRCRPRSATSAACYALVPCAGTRRRAPARRSPKQYVDVAGRPLRRATRWRRWPRCRALAADRWSCSRPTTTHFERLPACRPIRASRSRAAAARRARATVADGLAELRRARRDGRRLGAGPRRRALPGPRRMDRRADRRLPRRRGRRPARAAGRRHAEARATAAASSRRCRATQAGRRRRRRCSGSACSPTRWRDAGARRPTRRARSRPSACGRKLVPGSLENFKVTYPDDFALAEALLARASDVDA